MTCPSVLWRCAICLLACLCWSGCLPQGRGPSNEEKDPYYLSGISKLNSMDYSGAAESFEKALEVNPRSGAAHFELGIIYEQRLNKPAAAIYHFEQFLRYRPQSDMAETVKQRILACKQELARAVFPGPGNRDFQRELERLTEDNVRLQNRVKSLETQLVQRPVIPAPGLTNQPFPPIPPTAGAASVPVRAENPRTTPSGQALTTSVHGQITASATTPSPSLRTHVVKSGETLYAIARRYGITQSQLEAANPRISPERMQIGQTLNIPAR